MDGMSGSNLDVEYKRYLQIMRPYLGQLIDEEAINICNSWIKRLSNCSEREKPMRNRYIFVLCYQLAKGVLDMPFLNCPPVEELSPIPEVMDTESSTETFEYMTDADDDKTKIIYNNKKPMLTDTEYLSQDNDFDKGDSSRASESKTTGDEESTKPTRQQTILCYTCPELMRACAAEVKNINDDHYDIRANNLIMRLREIKKQNMLLHSELIALKEESKGPQIGRDCLVKVDHSTSVLRNLSSTTVQSLKTKLQEAEEDKQNLLDTMTSLQEQLDNFYEVKRLEMEDMEAKHKLEIAKLKASLRDESKDIYDDRLEELKRYYEQLLRDIKQNNESEVKNMKKRFEESLNEKDKIIQETMNCVHVKDKEVQDKEILVQNQDKKILELNSVLQEKDKAIEEKKQVIEGKDKELASLKIQIEDQNHNLQTILGKFLEKPSGDLAADNSMKIKAHELEKRLNRMEKSKAKATKMYEGKLAYLQREKHLAECSLQLQLVRQRAQVVNEIAEENQAELAEALDKLEAKYKDIVANVQSTAIQRRMQDQISLDAVLQAACGLRSDIPTIHSQFSGKTVTVRPKEENQSYESEISGIMRNKANLNKSYGEDSAAAGYCLDGERFGELFEKMHIPQRDLGEIPMKK